MSLASDYIDLAIAGVLLLGGILGFIFTMLFNMNGVINREMKPNHGTSMKDSVEVVGTVLADVQAGQRFLARQIHDVEQDARELHEQTNETFRRRDEHWKQTFAQRDENFIRIATPYAEEIGRLRRSDDQIIARLDALSEQFARDAAKVINKVDTIISDPKPEGTP